MFVLSDSFWRRLNVIAGFFVLLVTFGLLVFMAHYEIKDLDLWLHIGMGRYIVANNFQVPAVDILSCTVNGAPWVNHEWLFQVIVYFIHNSWGVDGLTLMQVCLVSVTLLVLVLLGYNRKNLLLTVFALFLVSLVYQTRFTIRPDLFSLFFLALYVAMLGMFIHRKWVIGALFVIQVLWANMHGFFFLGPLIVSMSLLGEWLKRSFNLPWEWNKVSRFTDKEYHRLKIILGVVIVACFLTPTGVQGALYPLKVLFQISGESKVFFMKIIELQPPITWNTIFSMGDWPYYKVLIIISFLSFWFNRRKLDVGIFLFWLFFLLFSLAAIRNLVFFAFAAYLAFVINIATIRFKDIIPVRFTNKRFVYITSIFAQFLLTFWALTFFASVYHNGYFDFDKYERKSEFGGVSQRQFPTKATEFLVKNKVRGNFFNDFNSGAYLVGHCFPNIKVFIDGRTEVYGPAFFQSYREIIEFDKVENLKVALKRFQITGVFLNSVQNPIPDNMLNYFYKNENWTLVYFDYDGMIFLKNTPINRDLIIHHRIDLASWKAKEMDLYRVGVQQVSPYQNFNRSFTLAALGLNDAAEAEARAALAVDPGYAGPYKILGKLAGKKKDFQSAYENFRIASVISPNDQVAKLNMALALTDLKKFDQAALEYEKIIERWPGSSKAHLKLAKVNIFRQKPVAAFANLKNGYELDSEAIDDVLELGNMFKDGKHLDLSRKTYELVLRKQPKREDVYLKIFETYDKVRDREQCIAILKKGLQESPEGKELKLKLRSLGVLVDKEK